MEFPVSLAGQTYDLKRFIHDHPGGANTLEHYKGKSVQQAMEKFGHSSNAYHILNDFKLKDRELEDSNLTGGVSANSRVITKEEAKRNVAEIEFLEELESRLDWSKSILGQLDLIAPHYSVWVNSAVYRKCLLFSNPLLESMTNTPWYWVPLFWVPTILYLGYCAFMKHVNCGDSCIGDPITIWYFIYQLALGLLFWTSLEYTLHRWVFHMDPGSNLMLIKIHFLLHGVHHKTPFDDLRLVLPPAVPALLACVLYWVMSGFVAYPMIKSVGALAGYLAYDVIHFYVHYGSPKDGSYLYAMKRYHSNHHFVNHDKAFGISNKLWDHVFRTIVHVRKLNFSLRW